MSDLAREVQKNYAKQLIEEAKKRANKTISDAYELLEKENKQQAETIERLRTALTNVKNCTESELAAYVKSVDSIACETLAKLETGDL